MPKSSPLPPDLSTQAGRLRWAREYAGFTSMRGAPATFGWPESSYKAHELGIRGKKGIPPTDIEKYARAFKVRAEWIAFGRGGALRTDDIEFGELPPEDKAKALNLLKIAKERS